MKKIFNQRGLTLIEIIVTLAVLGVVVAPLMSMFVTSQKVNVESKKEYEALQLAQKYMEEIKAMDSLSMSAFSPVDYDVISAEVSRFTGHVSSDGYDLTVVVEGAVDDGLGSGPAGIAYDFTRNVSSNDVINVTSKLGHENIKIILEADNIEIDVSNKVADHTVNLYIYSMEGKDYTAKVNVLEGSVRVFKNEATEQPPDNLLYNIEITVEKNSKKINTISGTTIFKYKPVKP